MLQALDSPPTELFWSAPLATDSDFTVEDPLALDYLGQQVGLWLFRGFTTRTNRAQNYAVVLYGLPLAELALRKYGYGGDDETRTRLFERWERFCALLRAVLRMVLRLTSKPVEQAARYHGEARHALQETPVVALVDAGERRPGRRLPFD